MCAPNHGKKLRKFNQDRTICHSCCLMASDLTALLSRENRLQLAGTKTVDEAARCHIVPR